MSSIKMHIAVSLQVQKYFNFSDKFLLGAVLPDILKIILDDRVITHFEDFYLCDIEKFLNLQEDMNDELLLGFYAHLLEDNIWHINLIDKKYMKMPGFSFEKMYDEYIYVDQKMYDELNLNSDEIAKKVEKLCENIDIKYVKLNNEYKIGDEISIDKMKNAIRKYCKNFKISKECCHYYNISDAKEYYNLAIKEVIVKINELIEKIGKR